MFCEQRSVLFCCNISVWWDRERLLWNSAEGDAETLRQKDRFRTELWRDARHRRRNPPVGESFRSATEAQTGTESVCVYLCFLLSWRGKWTSCLVDRTLGDCQSELGTQNNYKLTGGDRWKQTLKSHRKPWWSRLRKWSPRRRIRHCAGREAVILTNDEELAKKMNKAIFPGTQGGRDPWGRDKALYEVPVVWVKGSGYQGMIPCL